MRLPASRGKAAVPQGSDYLDDKERTLASPIERAMMALETFGAELERENRIEEFGEPDSSGRKIRQCVRLRINEIEAAVVRQIWGADPRMEWSRAIC